VAKESTVNQRARAASVAMLIQHKSCIQTTIKFVCSMSCAMKYELRAMLIAK
jgi:hypothetical protein